MKKKKRPLSVTILVLGVLTIAALGWARFYQAIRLAAFIETLEPSISPAYLALTGLVFGLAGVPTALGLWFGRPWAPGALRGFAAALAAFYWLDFLFFVVSDAARGSWPLAAMTTALALGWVYWVLSRAGAKAFFQKP